MRIVILLSFLFAFWGVQAQDEVELQIGDTLFFADCSGESYQFIDLYVKTRFEKDSISYDSLNGWEFYNRFFNTGDFDVSRMPCRYQQQYGIIKHMMSVEKDGGAWVNIIIVMITDGSVAAHLVEEAFAEEVIFAPAE